MADFISEKIKISPGFFSPKVMVLYKIKYVTSSEVSESKSISMFSDDGSQLGKLEYTKTDKKAKINIFYMDDWKTKAYSHRLLKNFLKYIKKQGVSMVECELYKTDNTIHNKLSLFRNCGFDVEGGGSLTGYQQYILKLKL